jgi:ABC-type tungstate transport system substrate-binding protein
MTQALMNLVCTIVMWLFFRTLNLSMTSSIALLYTTLMLIISLAISAIFSNTALKGYHVVVVCSFNGLNQVFRGLLLFLFFAKANGTIKINWLSTISPLLVGLKIMLILGVINLVFACRSKNRNKSKYLTS